MPLPVDPVDRSGRLRPRFGVRVTRRLGVRMFRYTAGSAVAFVVSELCFVALFGPHLLGAKGASIVASIVGVIPGYFLNRNWAWGRRGRSHPWREVLPYWVTVVVSTATAAITIGAVNHAASDLSRDIRTVINAATYFAVYGTLFVAKFAIFNSWLFRDSAGPNRQRDRDGQDDAADRAADHAADHADDLARTTR